MRHYSVALYCPDRAIVYDGRTPDRVGVGGGVTARLSMVQALAAMGHEVTAYVNCAEPISHGLVRYVPLEGVSHIRAEVLVGITTGGARTFAPLRGVSLDCRVRINWSQGVPFPIDLDALAPEYYYVCSNFMRDVAVDRWGVPASRVFVTYNGLKQEVFAAAERSLPPRDPFALVYVGPFEKGFDAALAVLRELRRHDDRYRLDVIGGPALWGMPVESPTPEPGLRFLGLMGQAALIPLLFTYEYLLAPQAMEEGFGIAVQEAKRAGVIVLVSRVGAYAELVAEGIDGFLVREPHASLASRDRMVEIVLALARDPDRRATIRRRALTTPWDWHLGARTWTAHWDYLFGHAPAPDGDWLDLPDGRHSTKTGYYEPFVRR